MKEQNWLINLCMLGLLWFSLAFACNNSDERGGTSHDGTTTRRTSYDTKTGNGTTSPMETQTGVGKPYGARDPRTCADTKSPTSGAITAAQAEQYVICKKEGLFRGDLFLVESLQITVGSSRPYNPNSDDYDSIDINAPIYPIRGNFDSYQCSEISDLWHNEGKNCNVWHEPKASGECYKTTFGDWSCNIEDNTSEMRSGFPPPR